MIAAIEGAGLGLSLVRGLVGLHEGSLLLELAFGVGTRVTALLPLTIAPRLRRVVSARLETIPQIDLAAARRRERDAGGETDCLTRRSAFALEPKARVGPLRLAACRLPPLDPAQRSPAPRSAR